MRKLFGAFLLFTLLITAQTIHAQELGLLRMDASGAPRYLSRVARELILKESARYGGTQALTPTELSERYLAAGGEAALFESCTEASCAAEIARTAGLDGVILAEITADGSAYGVSLRAVGADGETDLAAEELIFDLRDLDDGIARALENLAVAAGLIPAPEVASSLVEAEAQKAVPEPDPTLGSDETEVPGTEEESIPLDPPPEDIIGGTKIPELGDVAESSRSRLAAWNSGLLLLQLSGLGNLLTLYLDTGANTSYYLYLNENDQTKIDRFYREYEDYHLGARISAVSTYALNLAAPVSTGLALFSSDSNELAFSRRGRHYLYAGLFSSLAGNLVYLSGIDALVHRSYLQAKYRNDSLGEDYYEAQYQSLQGEVLATQGAALALWGLSSAAFLAAPNQGGPKYALASNFWDKVFITAGVGFLSGGNLMASLAGFNRTEAEGAWYDYLQADEDVAAKYARMEDEYDQYYLFSGLAAGFWAGGAMLFAAAELFDLPDPFPDRKRTASRERGIDPLTRLRFQPTPQGGAFYVHLEL